jgi:hypothetical protein
LWPMPNNHCTHSVPLQLFESDSTRKIAARMQDELQRLHTELIQITRGDSSWNLKRPFRFTRFLRLHLFQTHHSVALLCSLALLLVTLMLDHDSSPNLCYDDALFFIILIH